MKELANKIYEKHTSNFDKNEFKKEVQPGSYRLFQVADFVSTIRLLELKLNNSELSNSENKFIEQDAPEITVDVDDKYVDYSSDGTGYFKPVAIYGGNYPVPTATAFDGYSGNVKVTTKVYANYTDAQNTSPVAIEKDGTFKVESIGTYAIVYTAKDNMGNEAQRIYWITSVASIANPLALSIDTTSVAKDGVCGVKIPLAPYATVGGSGDVTVKITATCGDVELDVTSGELIAEKQVRGRSTTSRKTILVLSKKLLMKSISNGVANLYS